MGVTCDYFDQFWFPCPRVEVLAVNHADDRYARFDRFMAAEPDITKRETCDCGAPDRWKCWSKTRRKRFYGART